VNPLPVRVTVTDGEDIRFTRISTNAGLSQTRVAQIVQDDRGFVWFGTQYGLNRYDGYKFKVFIPDPSRANSLSGAYIYALFKDRSGMLWIGCDQYLDRLDPTTETFTHYRLEPPEGGASVTVEHISQDRAGILWLATGNGLYGLDPRNGRITQHYFHNPLNPSSLSSNQIRSTGEDRSGRFWVADASTLELLDRKTGSVGLRVTLASSARDFSFYEDSSGVLWIGYSGGSGFAALDPQLNKLTYYAFYDAKSKRALAASVFAMLQDKSGVLWLGTMGVGLLKFDREHSTAIRYRHQAENFESLAEDRVIALTQDREGNIWVGLHATEPNLFTTRRPLFRPLFNDGQDPHSLGENFVNAIYEDRRGVLWVAKTGALLGIDRKTGRHYSYPPPGHGLDNDVVTITEDRSGTIWVGTIGQGLNRFDPLTGKYRAYLHDPADSSSLSNDAVDSLLVDHTGTIWAGTWDGLDRFDPATGRFVVYKRDWQSRAEYYYGFTEDRDGALWLGGVSGLQRFDPRTGNFTGYQHKLDDPRSISDNRVGSTYVDAAGEVWAATENGLNKLDRRSGTFTRYYVKDGLPSNRLNSILGDSRGHLWISTNAGLSEYDPLRKAFKNYSTADGLPGLDLTGWGGAFKSRAGEMFFGGFSGGVSFYPEKIADSTYVPPVVLTDFRLAGVPVGVGGDSPLTQSISYARGLTLSHTQTMFELEFAALAYSNPAMNRYRYQLVGLDTKWHEVESDQRLVMYNTLPAGSYEFRVQGATSRGSWSDPTTLQITILPPWWKTAWFMCAFGVSLLLLTYAAYSYRMRQITRQFELRTEGRVEERTRIARDLHDTLLQSFQALMFHFQAVNDMLPPGNGKEALAKVLGRADQAIVEGRDAIQNIRSSKTVTNELSDSVTALGEELAGSIAGENRRATFRVSVDGTPRELHPILRDDIYRIAAEALRNAFRHAQASRIEAEITYSESVLRLRIRDDGKGIDPKHLNAGRDGHWGLPGMRERARQIGAQLEMWSEVGAGTEVQLSILGSIAYKTAHRRRGLRLFRIAKGGANER
jgi:ligand-binding sensor domain-containing protein/signal transduction histidine kinase